MSTDTSGWVLARHRLRDDVAATLLAWAGFALFVFVLVFAVAWLRGPIEISGWETGSQLPRWFAGALGAYATSVHLPLYVAHGYTRREVARQTPLAALVTVLLLAALMTAGYGLERLVYSLAGWSQDLLQPHLFSTPDAYGLVFVEFVLLFAVWSSAGALAGAGFYRSPGHGALVLPLALLLVGAAELVLSPGFFEVVTAFFGFLGFEPEGVSVGAAAAVSGGCIVVGLALTWLLVRDMPLRPREG